MITASQVQLPPRAGYVEKVDANGKHYYSPTAATLEKIEQQEKVASLEDENKLLKAQIEASTERSDFLEDVIAEMAVELYSSEEEETTEDTSTETTTEETTE